KAPEAILILAEFLGRHGRAPEACDLCRKAALAGAAPLAVADIGIEIMRQQSCGPEFPQFIEKVLLDARAKDPKQIMLLLILAKLRDAQSRYADVAAVYRQVLEQDHDSVIALNNLAWFLTLQGDAGKGALEAVERAIQLAGPRAELLDTRGMIKLIS